MRLVYSNLYNVDIGEHPWMTSKYDETVRLVQKEIPPAILPVVGSPMAADEDILRTHTFEFWQKLCDCDFTEDEDRLLELPMTSAVIDFFWRMAGGSVQATELALEDGLCVHVGGGFHHAFPDYGAGFCLINDIGVSVQSALDRGLADRVAIIDCDVHQGDGTARIFKDNQAVVTFSIHQERNFPHIKQQSTIDVPLENDTSDEAYLNALKKGLQQVADMGPFDMVHYQAGADPYENDTLGGLSLTIAGLQRRDKVVLEWATQMGASVVITLGGGYTETLDEVVRIHANTVLAALDVSDAFPASRVAK